MGLALIIVGVSHAVQRTEDQYVSGVQTYIYAKPFTSHHRQPSTVVNGGWAVAHPPILRLPKRSDKVTNDKKIKFITLTYY